MHQGQQRRHPKCWDARGGYPAWREHRRGINNRSAAKMKPVNKEKARQLAGELLRLKTRAGIAELEVELAERENRLAIRERELAGREDRVAKREHEVATREEQVAKRAKRPTKKKRGPKQPKKAKDKDRTWEQEVIELLLPDPGPNSLLV